MYNLFYEMGRIMALVVSEGSPLRPSASLYRAKGSSTGGLWARAAGGLQAENLKGFQLCRHRGDQKIKPLLP